MGDSKTEKDTENAEKEESGSLSFKERRDDLFREASELIAEVPSAKIAIFVSDPSSDSVYSFGHPSADGLLKDFLEDGRSVPVPVDSEEKKDPGFWWEDEKLVENLTNPEELQAAYDALTRVRNNLLEARKKTDQGSANQEDIHDDDDKAGPKP